MNFLSNIDIFDDLTTQRDNMKVQVVRSDNKDAIERLSRLVKVMSGSRVVTMLTKYKYWFGVYVDNNNDDDI